MKLSSRSAIFHKRWVLVTSILWFTTLILQSCTSDEVQPITKEKVNGFVQKGPYLNGTTITIAELSQDLTATGKNFTTQIIDNTGTFEINNITLESQFVELRADGFYFNEVSGFNSTAQMTMFALANISNLNSINVNILSHLESKRVKKLIGDGLSFSEAKDQAQAEVLDIFSIQSNSIDDSEKLDISKSGEGNTILMAISVILQANRSVADLAELLANISTDITNDGLLDNQNLMTEIVNKVQWVNLSVTRQNIEDRYAALGVAATIGDFESIIEDFVSTKVPFDVTYTVKHPCFETQDGEISLFFSHDELGDPWMPSLINWFTSAENCWQHPVGDVHDATIELVCNGVWTAEVTDEDGFSIIMSIIVSEAGSPVSLSIATTNTTMGGNTGAIDLTPSGGTAPYTTMWSNAETSEDINGLEPGTYGVTVTDASDCKIIKNVPVYFTITDSRDNQEYEAIPIGSQSWMAENLNIGTRIDLIIAQTDNSAIEKYSYDDNEDNSDLYGGLYQSAEAMNYTTVEGAQGICPSGWHIPSDNEWKIMEMYLGMSSSDADLIEWDNRGTDEGNKLREAPCNDGGYQDGPECAISGFGGELAGLLESSEYRQLDQFGYFLSSSGLIRRLGTASTIGRENSSPSSAYSLRCIMD